MKPHELKVVDWGNAQIEMETIPIPSHLIAIHHKEDGSVDNEPSFCFVSYCSPMMRRAFNVFHEVTLKTLNHNLKKIGYRIVRDS